MWTRTLAGVACALLAASGVPADSITIEGKTWEDVLVTETDALYYVMFPETGRSAGYAKDNIDPASVIVEPDAEKRRALRERFEATRPPLPEPHAAEGPKLIRDPDTAESADPEPAPSEAPWATEADPTFETAAPEDFAAPVSPAAPVPGAWRQSKIRVGRPDSTTLQPRPQATPPAPRQPAPVNEGFSTTPPDAGRDAAAAPDPYAVEWTQEPAPEAAAAADPTALAPDPALPPDPALAEAAALPAPPQEDPVVINHQAFVDEDGVKSLVIKGNRQRDPYREARILQKIRAEEAAEAEALARQQAEWAAATAAAEQAAYDQWMQEQANWEAYAAEQMAAPPQIVQDQWGLSIQGGGDDPYAALLQMEGYDTY